MSGQYVFVYKGKNYIFYNSMDSYPESLGRILVNMIRTEDYTSWGEILVDHIDNKNYKIRKLEYNNCRFTEVKYNKGDLDEEFVNNDSVYDLQCFTNDKMIWYLKWDFKCLLKHNKSFTQCLVENFCPTMDRSTPVNGKLDLDNYEWTYIIDLDKLDFKVFGGEYDISFRLTEIPFNWID